MFLATTSVLAFALLALPQTPPSPAPSSPAPSTSATSPATPAVAYDPMQLPERRGTSFQFTVHDLQRTRQIPLRVYLPADEAPAPVVLWSHGLGGSCENSPYLGQHWSARGYVVVMMQHAGSDEAVWKDSKPRERYATLQKAASGKNLQLRAEDVKAVLDQLTTWNGEQDHLLRARLDLEHVGMCGHSFGAVTTQAVSGQILPLFGAKWTDPRIDAALPMSPSKPRAGDVGKAFGAVKIPWLLMTGTEDTALIADLEVADRLVVFPALPSTIDRYELVLDGAQHSVFGERALPGEREPKEAHHRTILALSTAFWDSHLRGDPAAKQWLHGDGARTVLTGKDSWRWAAAGDTTKFQPAGTPVATPR